MKKGYQPRTRIVKDEKSDLVADSHSIMVRQAEIHTAEPLVPEPSCLGG